MRREILFCAVAVLCRLALTADVPSTRLDLRVDDGLYVRTADHLLAGEWQGPYDHCTLAKSIGYPAFLAAARRLGIPARAAADWLLCLAAVALWGALRSVGVSAFTACSALLVVLFSPATLSPALNRVTREGIYPAQVVLVFAGLIGLLGTTRWWWRGLIAAMTGPVVAWTWHTREESLWLAPSLALAALLTGVVRSRQLGWRAWLEVIFAAAIVMACISFSTTYIARSNLRHYGAETLVELQDEDFADAIGAIQRVAPEEELPYGARTDEDFERLFRESPALATVRPTLDGPLLRRDFMVEGGHRILNFQTWAIREGAAAAGQHTSLPNAKAFYRRVAKELDSARDAGRLPTSDRDGTVIPFPSTSQLGETLTAVGEGFGHLAGARIIPGGTGLMLPLTEVSEDEEMRFARVLGEERRPDLRGLFVRRVLVHRVEGVFRSVTPWLTGLGALSLLVLLITTRRRLAPATAAATLLFGAAVTRVGMLAILKTIYFPFAFNYLLTAHVLALVAWLVATDAWAFRVLGRRLPTKWKGSTRVLGVLAILGLPTALALSWGQAWPRAPHVAPTAIAAKALHGRERLVIASPHFRFEPCSSGIVCEPRPAAVLSSVRKIDVWNLTPKLERPSDVLVRGRVVERRTHEPIEGAVIYAMVLGRGEGGEPVGGSAAETGPDGSFEFRLETRLERCELLSVGLVRPLRAALILEEVALFPSR